MSILFDDEPPKRRRKDKSEKSATVRGTSQSSHLRIYFDDHVLA